MKKRSREDEMMPPHAGCENTGGQNSMAESRINEANASRQKKKEAPSAMWDTDVEVLKEIARLAILGILEQKETRSVRDPLPIRFISIHGLFSATSILLVS
jgi:hypothetical protein